MFFNPAILCGFLYVLGNHAKTWGAGQKDTHFSLIVLLCSICEDESVCNGIIKKQT